MELLCPVGSFESLKAAVQNGADAVYFGGGRHNARRLAENITDLRDAVSYAHLRGCRVYFTLNTLVLDKELADWAAIATDAALAGVDAFIMQDLGGSSVLRHMFPDVPLHASTQMTTHNTANALALEALGFSRVILARELTAEQVRTIKHGAGIGIEIFAHGALCYGYSGQCYMSSMLGGRSANRGLCAQPCRLPYQLDGANGYLLSTKDLCLLGRIQEIADAGVDCIKIEGRMKRPEYVAAVTRAYRRAIDGVAPGSETREMLALAFNRGRFTEGMFGHDTQRLYTRQPGHIGLSAGSITAVSGHEITLHTQLELMPGDDIAPAIPDAKPAKILQVRQAGSQTHITLNHTSGFQPGGECNLLMRARLTEELQQHIAANNIKTPLYAKISIRTGSPSAMEAIAPDGTTVHMEGAVAEKAKKHPLTEDIVKTQLRKTGYLSFSFPYMEITLDADASLPLSALNKLRRDTLAAMEKAILEKSVHTPATPYTPIAKAKRPRRHPLLAAQVFNLEQARAAAPYVDILYIPAHIGFSDADFPDKTVIAYYPPITTDNELTELNKKTKERNCVMTGTLLGLRNAKCADHTLNVTNSASLALLGRLGFTRATLSTELNAAQINDIAVPDGMQTEAVVYGRLALMTSAHCPCQCDGTKCRLQKDVKYLTDRKGAKFPLVRYPSACRVALLNSVPIYMADKLDAIQADVLRLCFTVEPPGACGAIARLYRNALAGGDIPQYEGPYTRGHFFRGFE